MKSRSLEPLTGLAMWSSEPQIIELIKGERGLGFSILDYQDPIDPNDTVIVIRSLVPGGVAQLDGRLIPGDRLEFANIGCFNIHKISKIYRCSEETGASFHLNECVYLV